MSSMEEEQKVIDQMLIRLIRAYDMNRGLRLSVKEVDAMRFTTFVETQNTRHGDLIITGSEINL